MKKKTKEYLLYLITNIATVFAMFGIYALYPKSLTGTVFYYWYMVALWAFTYMGYCPFKIIARYVVYTNRLNFVRYWNKAYGRRAIAAWIIYGGLALFSITLLTNAILR